MRLYCKMRMYQVREKSHVSGLGGALTATFGAGTGIEEGL